ncbi:hypothetical protein [Streptococcus sp. DD12]|uniref:hypothetical protein n=1 Tax=Streptococcus sp. DD12 TaxID=1777880 RepID=UPI000794E0DF|nr:hypothetical protein [Streptococcus sp. DD12]KXT75327.1 hypothetical protein STRDD12_01448 [Streptococcus sp. DD12]
MNKADWLDYFETVNGRKPSEEELQAALAAGEFEEESDSTDAVTDASTSSSESVSESLSEKAGSEVAAEVLVTEAQVQEGLVQSQTNAQTAGVVPPTYVLPQEGKKFSTKKLLLIIAAVLAVLVLTLGAGTTFYYISGNVDGSYHNKTLETKLKKSWKESQSTSAEDVLSDANVNLDVKKDKAVATLTMKMDYSSYYKSLKKTYDWMSDSSLYSSYYSYFMPSYLKSESAFDSYMDDNMKETLEDAEATYDAKTNTITYVIFKGNVDRWSRAIKVTWVNKTIYKDSSSNGESVKDAFEKSLKFKKGSYVSYKKEANKLILNNKSDSAFVKR